MTFDARSLGWLSMLIVLGACASQPLALDTQPPWWPEETRATATLTPTTALDKVNLEVQWSAPPLDDGVLTQLVLKRGDQTLHSVPANLSVLIFEVAPEAGSLHLYAQDSHGRLSAGLEIVVTQEMVSKVTTPRHNAPPSVAGPNNMDKMMDAMKVYEKPSLKP